jgi:hypothetical protein
VSWALGWHHARRDDATPLEVPAEGDPWLAVYRVAGMMAAGAAPAALARFELGPAVDGAALVLPAVGLAIGVARASSGAPPELPQLLALVLAAHPREEDPAAEPARRGEPGGRPPKPTGRPAAPIGRTVVPEPTVDEASVVAAAAAAAAPVDDGAESEGRAFARRLAQQALEAQLRVIRREEARAAAAAAAEREVSEAEAQATREAAARERAAAAAAAAASAREAAAAAARAAEIAEAAAVAAAAEVGEAPIVVVLAERADDGG